MNKLDITLLGNIALIVAIIALLLLSIGIVIRSLIVFKKYNVFKEKRKTTKSALNLSTSNSNVVINVNNDKKIPITGVIKSVVPIACAWIPLAIVVMINDGPDPCELKQSILLDSSYDKKCNSSYIDII